MATEGITAITMPKLGMTMTEGKIAAWRVKAGDPVDLGDEIIDIETEKITNVCEAPAKGVFRRRNAHESDTLPVGALIGVIADANTPEADIDTFISSFNQKDVA